jgi:hypothetical protein
MSRQRRADDVIELGNLGLPARRPMPPHIRVCQVGRRASDEMVITTALRVTLITRTLVDELPVRPIRFRLRDQLKDRLVSR